MWSCVCMCVGSSGCNVGGLRMCQAFALARPLGTCSGFFFFFCWKRRVTADFSIPATMSRPSKDRQERRATRQAPPVRVGTTLPPHGYVGGTLQCNPAQSTGVQGPTMHPFCFYSTSLPHSKAQCWSMCPGGVSVHRLDTSAAFRHHSHHNLHTHAITSQSVSAQ